tara:strand:+ start:26 stop:403 length:378 start_codon:yes stop_codon:yes gene_type:complete
MSYFSNPNFMYLQERGNYSNKEIDKFIIKAYQKGRTKVIYGNKKYVVAKEIPRIQNTTKFHKPNSKKIEKDRKKTLEWYKKDSFLNIKISKYLKNKSTKNKTVMMNKKSKNAKSKNAKSKKQIKR